MLLIPNIGADAGLARDDADNDAPDLFQQAADFPDPDDPVLQAAVLWQTLFSDRAHFAAYAARQPPVVWPAVLGARPPSAAFAGLDLRGAAVAWINSNSARRIAERDGRTLFGAPPAVVRLVHDQAFAQRVAVAEGLHPAELRERIETLDPELLRDADAARRRIFECVARWPDWTERRFTLKPRFGTSGRGRVAGVGDQLAAGVGGLRRLAETGGALLEPWLKRKLDLSAQFWIEPNGALTLLGTLELLVDGSGLYRGHRGSIDSRGRVRAGSAYDEPLRESAVTLVQAAARAGYRGPCGVDAFVFEVAGRETLRPVVEFNARFTLGTVVLGLLRRVLAQIRDRFALGPGETRDFFFALAAPRDGWPRAEDGLLLPLWDAPAGASGPALLLGSDRRAIDQQLALHALVSPSDSVA